MPRSTLVRRFLLMFAGSSLIALVLVTFVGLLMTPGPAARMVAEGFIQTAAEDVKARYWDFRTRLHALPPERRTPSHMAELAESGPQLRWDERGEPQVVTLDAEVLAATLLTGLPVSAQVRHYVLDETGAVLARQPPDVPSPDPTYLTLREDAPIFVTGPRPTVALRTRLRGTSLSVLSMRSLGLEAARYNFPAALQRFLPILSILTGSLLLAAWLAATYVTRPLADMEAKARRIAEGDFSSRLDVRSKDEIGALAEAFNRMAEAVEARERDLTAALEHRKRFLRIVSHELRTPLSAVMGYTELLIDGLKGPVTEKQQDVLRKVHRNAEALLSLISDLLDLSRMDAGKLRLAKEPMSLVECIDSACTAIEPQAQSRHLELRREVPGDDPLVVEGDFERLRQVVVNLLSNAVKFTAQGTVGVVARRDGERAVVEVWDTGPGFATEALAHLFEEFHQGDDSITRTYGGTGLGLAISQRLIELHDGRITADNRAEGGARVRLVLPLNAVRPSAGGG